MPTYDFVCKSCETKKTENVKYEERTTQTCPNCGGAMNVDYSSLMPTLKNVH